MKLDMLKSEVLRFESQSKHSLHTALASLTLGTRMYLNNKENPTDEVVLYLKKSLAV